VTTPTFEDFEHRARHAAQRLRQASALEAPELTEVLHLAKLGRVVTGVVGFAALTMLAGAVLALGSVAGGGAVIWIGAAVMIALIATTLAVCAHAGGHAWFVPLPAAILASVWLVSEASGDHAGGLWWLASSSAAFSAGAAVLGLGVLKARVVGSRLPVRSLVGATGTVVVPLAPVGIARVQGETWTAESLSGPLPVGAAVHVVRMEGLRLLVWSEAGVVPGIEALPDGASPRGEE
jgi:membrane-bound ClpP family serine protease